MIYYSALLGYCEITNISKVQFLLNCITKCVLYIVTVMCIFLDNLNVLLSIVAFRLYRGFCCVDDMPIHMHNFILMPS